MEAMDSYLKTETKILMKRTLSPKENTLRGSKKKTTMIMMKTAIIRTTKMSVLGTDNQTWKIKEDAREIKFQEVRLRWILVEFTTRQVMNLKTKKRMMRTVLEKA